MLSLFQLRGFLSEFSTLEPCSSLEQSVSGEQGVQVCLVTHLDKGRHSDRLFGENRKHIGQRHKNKEKGLRCKKSEHNNNNGYSYVFCLFIYFT